MPSSRVLRRVAGFVTALVLAVGCADDSSRGAVVSDAGSTSSVEPTARPTTATTMAATTTTTTTTTSTLTNTTPDYAQPGPFLVGRRDFVIPDKAARRPLPFTVWYPALTSSGDGDNMGAAPALEDGPYPLVVISHGLGGTNLAYSALAIHLASYGFVVVAAIHPDASSSLAQRTVVLLYDRPDDIMREIAYTDALTSPKGALAGLIDTEHIAVIGHSTGGTTAFQAGGARVDLHALEAWCKDKGSVRFARESCQFVGQDAVLAARYGAGKAQAGLYPAHWDTRVDAIVAMAPGGELHAFGDDGIAVVQVPTLILVGTADAYVSPEYNAFWAYDHIASHVKTLVSFKDGSHLMFLNCCNYDPARGGPRFEDLTAHLTTAFLLDILKGDQTAHKALLPGAVRFPGVEYRTTIK